MIGILSWKEKSQIVEYIEIDDKGKVKKGIPMNYQEGDDELVITIEDMSEECKYWYLAAIGYVLGENILFKTIEGIRDLVEEAKFTGLVRKRCLRRYGMIGS
ncbi:hypothetical protein Droror1_Dr00022360 [Drosera rotundifolia]